MILHWSQQEHLTILSKTCHDDVRIITHDYPWRRWQSKEHLFVHVKLFFVYRLQKLHVHVSCRGTGCKGPHWEYTPWGQCSAKCGGGTASRQALCLANASDASVAQPSVCAGLPMPEPLARQCNLSPCEIHTWSVGPWGACSAPCEGQPYMALSMP